MPAPSLTYTLTNGNTADASQVMQNFNDLLNGISDGTKDLSFSALTVAGTATLNGSVNIGNASSDDLSITASLASSIPIKTTNSYDIGSSTLLLRNVYTMGAVSAGSFGANGSSATAVTLTFVSPEVIVLASPSGAINQDLPTTNVKAGRKFTFIITGCTTTNTVTVRSSGANNIAVYRGTGRLTVVAAIDTPTTAAHWLVVESSDIFSYTPTVGTISGYTTSPVGYCRRLFDHLDVYVAWQKDANIGIGAAVVTISLPVAINTALITNTANVSIVGYAEYIVAYTSLRSVQMITSTTVGIGLAASQMIATDFAGSSYLEMRLTGVGVVTAT